MKMDDRRHHSAVGVSLMKPEVRCDLCSLGCKVKHTRIDHRGSETPKILLIGEAPGPEEDKIGQPFVGRAGQKLDELITLAGVPRDVLQWSNVVRCQPMDQFGAVRQPTPDEALTCVPYLWHDIKKYDPSVIIALGGVAAAAFGLLPLSGDGINSIRGQMFNVVVGGKLRSVFATNHPAAVLRGNRTASDFIVATLSAAFRMVSASSPDKASSEVPKDEKRPTPQYRILNNTEAALDYMERVRQAYRSGMTDAVAFDIETTDVNAFGDIDCSGEPVRLVGFGLCYKVGEAAYIPYDHTRRPADSSTCADPVVESRVDQKQVLAGLGELLKEVPVICHNALFDVGFVSYQLGLSATVADDTLLQSFQLWAGDRSHKLSTCAELDLNQPSWKDGPSEYIAQSYRLKKYRHYGNVPLAMLGEYCCYDVEATFALRQEYNMFMTQLDTWPPPPREGMSMASIRSSYNRWMRALRHFLFVEKRASFVDLDYWKAKRELYPQMMKAEVDKLRDHSAFVREWEAEHPKKTFNPFSSPQVQWLFYEKMKLAPPTKKKATKRVKETKSISTDDDAMIELHDNAIKEGRLDDAEAVRLVRQYRKIYHIVKAYFNKIPKFQRKGTSNLTVHFHLHSESGRLRSKDFSLHTCPKKSDARRMFVSEWFHRGGLIFGADYSQMELRVLASLSKDPTLLQAFNSGSADIHSDMARAMFRIPEGQKVPKQMRSAAKAITFGILYGRGAKNISKDLNVSKEEAEEFIRQYFARFPTIGGYIDSKHDFIKKHGYVEIPTGRIRWVQKGFSGEEGEVSAACREGFNTIIQGAASDVCLEAFMLSQEEFTRRGMESRGWLFTHDSINVDVYPGELMDVYRVMKDIMETRVREVFPWIGVPLTTDPEFGSRWDGAVTVKTVGPTPVSFSQDEEKKTIDLRSGEFLVKGKLAHLKETVSVASRAHGVYVDSDVLSIELEEEQTKMVPKQPYEGDSGGREVCTATFMLTVGDK